MKRDDSKKFVVYGFDGNPKQWYVFESARHDANETAIKKEVKPGHTVVIVDRSGSMYADIGPLKEMLVKLLTLDEYNNSSMLVSLISYSTSGDCKVHFDRVPVREVMKSGSKQQAEIRKIASSGLTCISQALNVAKGLVRSDEPTAIVLHSDGYANDPSVWSEQRQVLAVCEGFRGQNVFVNTVAYRESSDFSFLSSVANAVSGKCIKAGDVKQVYDALHDAASSVNGTVMPPIEVEKGKADYVVFMSRSKGKVNGAANSLSIAGMSPDDDGTAFWYYETSKENYDKAPYPVAQHGEHILALSRAKLAEGRLNEAKLAAYSSCIDKFASHAKALTGPQLAAMAKDIEDCLFNYPTVKMSCDKPKSLGGAVTVTGVLMALEAARDGIMLNLKSLQENYKLRGVKRVPGTRTPIGIEKPWLEQEFIDSGDWVPMGTFDFNRNSATINLLIARPSRLVKVADRKPVSEVAGVNVASLPSFRNYTIVGDGEVVVPKLTVKFGTKEAFDLFHKLWVLNPNAKFDPMSECTILLSDLPVSSFDFSGDVTGMVKAYREVLGYKVVAGILGAITKETSADYTPEQLAELKRHYLSASLNINFPTTTEYDDLDAALADGRVDTRVSYKVEVGDSLIINSGRLFSANEFLARHFMVTGGAVASDKPKMTMFLDPKCSFKAKPPSPKMKLTEVDAFMKPIFEDFLGLASNGAVKKVLNAAGIDKSVMDVVRGGVKSMVETRKAVEAKMDEVYRDKIMPFTFFVGATGLFPDCLDAKGLSAEELESQIAGLKLGKDERDGTFFKVYDLVISVYAKNEYYSTGKTA